MVLLFIGPRLVTGDRSPGDSLMSDIAEKVSTAIRQTSIRRVAETLGISRGATTAVAAGVATAGTLALVREGLPRLERMLEAR
jgi:hypothetical protein